jgi:hypothetical protein
MPPVLAELQRELIVASTQDGLAAARRPSNRACADTLARCAVPHQLDGRRFHGPVSVMIEKHLWDGYNQAADKAG